MKKNRPLRSQDDLDDEAMSAGGGGGAGTEAKQYTPASPEEVARRLTLFEQVSSERLCLSLRFRRHSATD